MNQKELLPSTDPQKLRLLATWFDMQQKKKAEWDSTEVQQDLRRVADKIETLEAENARLRKENAELVEALELLLKDVDCSDYGEVGIDNPSPVTHKPGLLCPVCVARAALAKGGE